MKRRIKPFLIMSSVMYEMLSYERANYLSTYDQAAR